MSGTSPGSFGGTIGTVRRSNMPEWMLGPDDLGQVMVLVLRRKNDQQGNQDVPLPNSFIVGTTIELKIGAKEARTINASREGRGTRYLLRTSSKVIYEKLTKITHLTDGTEIEIVPHPTLNTAQGIVYDAETVNMEETVMLEYLKAQGIQAVRRIKKRVNGALKNTPLVVLSFHGTIVPDHVFFGLERMKVRVYYPTPMMCFNCGFYGHSKKACLQPEICLRCSTSHEVPEGEQCSNLPHCLHCQAGHQVTSRDCPKYKEEETIVRLKVDKNISFIEARRIYAEEKKQGTIAEVVQEQIQKQLAAKDQVIAALQKQVAMLTKELADLKHSLGPARSSQPSPSSHEQSVSDFKKPAAKATMTTPVKRSMPAQNDRLSRKDQPYSSQSTSQQDRHQHRQEHGMQTRSRSNKRQMEISPTESNNHRGKRISAPSETISTSIDIENNNGPGTL